MLLNLSNLASGGFSEARVVFAAPNHSIGAGMMRNQLVKKRKSVPDFYLHAGSAVQNCASPNRRRSTKIPL